MMAPGPGKHRILLVDDEPGIVKLLARRLEAEGFQVAVAMDGDEALQKVKTEAVDLVILDIMLPKVDGYQVCRLLKGDPQYRKIPIILFTAKVQEQDERRGFECGADAYVRKPFRAQELIGQIRRLL